jgi:hypothetical protein
MIAVGGGKEARGGEGGSDDVWAFERTVRGEK